MASFAVGRRSLGAGLQAPVVSIEGQFVVAPYAILDPDMYKRIVLKLSGEALAGNKGFGLDAERVQEITSEVVEVRNLGVEVAVVVGGGNFFRGVAQQAK